MAGGNAEADDGTMPLLLTAPARPHGHDQKLAALAASPLGVGRLLPDLVELAQAFELVDVTPGTVLQDQGVRVRWWGVVVAGSADVCVDWCVMGALDPGDSFGAVPIAGRRPSSVCVVAATPMRIALLDGRRLRDFVARHPQVASCAGLSHEDWASVTPPGVGRSAPPATRV